MCVGGGFGGGGAVMQRDRFRSLTHCQDEYSGSENKTPGVGRRREECVGRGWEDRGCWVTSEVLQPHRTNKYSVQKNKQKKHAENMQKAGRRRRRLAVENRVDKVKEKVKGRRKHGGEDERSSE